MSAGSLRGKFLSHSEYIGHQLKQARGRIKGLDIALALAVVAVAAAGYVLTLIVADQLLALSGVVRLVLLLAFAGSAAAYLWFGLFLPSLKRINPLFAAREIERARPELKNSVLNFLELSAKPDHGVSEPIMAAIEKRAAGDLQQVNLHEALTNRHLAPASLAFLGVVAAFCVYAMFFTQKSLAVSLQRVLYPLADIKPPSATTLTAIEPGDANLHAGDKLTISCFASGARPI